MADKTKGADEKVDAVVDDESPKKEVAHQVAKKDSYESLYNNERKKSQILLISTATFAALFLISIAFGLRAVSHETARHDTFKPGGMMHRDSDRRGPGSQYYQ